LLQVGTTTNALGEVCGLSKKGIQIPSSSTSPLNFGFDYRFRLDRESSSASGTQNVLFLSLIYDGNKDVYQFYVKRRVVYYIKCLSFTIDKTCIGIVIHLFDINTAHIN
jgi:hypothetical protein